MTERVRFEINRSGYEGVYGIWEGVDCGSGAAGRWSKVVFRIEEYNCVFYCSVSDKVFLIFLFYV